MKRTILILISASMLVSCESQRNLPRRYDNSDSRNKINWEPPVVSLYGNGETDKEKKITERQDPARLIQYNAQLNLSVKIPDSTIAHCKRVAEKYEGYAQTLSSGKAVIRVKSELLNAAIADISGFGEVTYKNVYSDDVTEDYYDFKTRLENLERARKRYLELLDKAANVQEALAVEKELERVNGEIDVLKGKISRLQHLVAYSTITVYVNEKLKPGPVGYIFIGLWKGVKWLFVRN